MDNTELRKSIADESYLLKQAIRTERRIRAIINNNEQLARLRYKARIRVERRKTRVRAAELWYQLLRKQ